MDNQTHRNRGLIQIARPDGNAFERWKWRHRYFIWTWSLSGAFVCLARELLNPVHPRWELLSWFTLSSYLIAIPIAIAVGAIISGILSHWHRDWNDVGRLAYKCFRVLR